MFGIFYAIFMGIASLVDTIKQENFRAESQAEAQSKGQRVYYDMKARPWVGNRRCISGIINGHRVLQDAKTGQVLIDYTAEEMDRKIKLSLEIYRRNIKHAKEKGHKAFSYMLPNYETRIIEIATNKRIYLSSLGDLWFFKYYYKMDENLNEVVDYDSRVQLTKEEWRQYCGYMYDGK